MYSKYNIGSGMTEKERSEREPETVQIKGYDGLGR